MNNRQGKNGPRTREHRRFSFVTVLPLTFYRTFAFSVREMSVCFFITFSPSPRINLVSLDFGLHQIRVYL